MGTRNRYFYLVLISYEEIYTILRMYPMPTTTRKFFSQNFAERLHKDFSYCVLNYARADGQTPLTAMQGMRVKSAGGTH